MQFVEIETAKFFKNIFSSPRFAWLWLLVRVYVGYQWFSAGWEKLFNPIWVGEKAGVAVAGFLQGALNKTAGAHPDVSSWYGFFVQNVALPHAQFFSYIVTYGELLVGIALILGLFVGIAATFGGFMNFNYLFAGTVSVNPQLLLLEFLLILAWRSAGWYGLDRWLLAKLGTPWKKGTWFFWKV